MKEYFEKVNVKDELPTENGWQTTSNGKLYFHINRGWSDSEYELNSENESYPEWWLKPLPLISREKMIDVIKNVKHPNYSEYNYSGPDYVENIADSILNAGIPEKTDIEEMIKKLPVGQYSISEPLVDFDVWYIHTNDKDFSGKTLTEAITNYYNSIK